MVLGISNDSSLTELLYQSTTATSQKWDKLSPMFRETVCLKGIKVIERTLMLIWNCYEVKSKFHEIILKGIKVIERTLMLIWNCYEVKSG